MSDQEGDHGPGADVDEGLKSGRGTESDQFPDQFGAELPPFAGGDLALVLGVETDHGGGHDAEAADAGGDSGAEDAEGGQSALAEDEDIVEKDVEKASGDVDDRDRNGSSLPGEEGEAGGGHAEEDAAGQEAGEVFQFARDEFGGVPAVEDAEPSDRRNEEGDDDAGGDGEGLPGPDGVEDAGAVVGAVVLGDQGGGVVAGGHEEGEEREVEDSGRHGGGDVERRVFRQELAVDELHDAVARAHDDERIGDAADFQIAAMAEEIPATERFAYSEELHFHPLSKLK